MADRGHVQTKNAKGQPAGRRPGALNRVAGSDLPTRNKPVTKPTR